VIGIYCKGCDKVYKEVIAFRWKSGYGAYTLNLIKVEDGRLVSKELEWRDLRRYKRHLQRS